MKMSHGKTTLKQEVNKLKFFIIGLFNPSIIKLTKNVLNEQFVTYKIRPG